MAERKLNSREELAIPTLYKRSAEVRRSAQETIRSTEEHLVRAEAVVTASTMLIDRARATLDALAKKRQGRAHPTQNNQNKNKEE